MSSQIMDTLEIEKNIYDITEVSTSDLMFNPLEFGLFPQAICTACFRGHWCEYQIKDSMFVLNDFYMHNSLDNYPIFNGVSVSEYEKTGHKKYENVQLVIPYTGKMLVGKDVIYEFLTMASRQRPWAYKKLIECTFENGRVVSLVNCSSLAKKIRSYLRSEGLSKQFVTYDEIPKGYLEQIEWVL